METPGKTFTIHIHGTAEYEKDDAKFEGIVNFDQLVNLYFRSNKDKFEKFLRDIGGVQDNSFLYNLRFDSVDKEIR